jgi:hypothetical protein
MRNITMTYYDNFALKNSANLLNINILHPPPYRENSCLIAIYKQFKLTIYSDVAAKMAAVAFFCDM